jgi:hypothetical protein
MAFYATDGLPSTSADRDIIRNSLRLYFLSTFFAYSLRDFL